MSRKKQSLNACYTGAVEKVYLQEVLHTMAEHYRCFFCLRHAGELTSKSKHGVERAEEGIRWATITTKPNVTGLT
jgi:hypothetical protein